MASRFTADLEFLRAHTDVLVLGDPAGPALILAPQYQGRVMTSTAGSATDYSFGWINYDLIRSGRRVPQINLYGGEERFWLAPEGGRFSIFFPPAPLDQPLTFADWRVPDCLDTQAFEVVALTDRSAHFAQQATLHNRLGTEFEIGFQRQVTLLETAAIAEILGCHPRDLAGVPTVAHESQNRLVNEGSRPWQPETGLLAIWVLGMNSPSPDATMIVPYQREVGDFRGGIVNADYFGQLGPDRLSVDEARGLIFLRGDGNFRSKLGLTYPRSVPRLAAWDRSRQVLTIASYNRPAGGDTVCEQGLVRHVQGLAYVNNLWRVAADEFAGDVINAYNDGPNDSGSRLGGFFELESLSPALALAPGQGYTHCHRTVHLEATTAEQRQQVNRISERCLGVGLAEIEQVFSQGTA
jgi:hypothetical protein